MVKPQREIERVVWHNMVEIERIMEDKFQRRLWRVSENDKLRLLKLRTWEDRFHVKKEFILGLLLPIWWGLFNTRAKQGFGVKLTTLLGKKSESILRATLESDEGIVARNEWKEFRKAEIRTLIAQDDYL